MTRKAGVVASFIASFTGGNPFRFHDSSGRGYRFLADQVLKLDRINPHGAARQVQPLGTWRRHDGNRQAMMRRELQRILATPDLSKNCYEMASKSLA